MSFEGRVLFQNGGASTVRVGWSNGNSTYVLWDGKKRILTRREKKDIAAEFYKHIGQGVDVTEHLSFDWKPTGQILNDYPAPDGTTKKMQVRKASAQMEPAEICSLFSQIYQADPLKAEALSGIAHLSKLATMDWAFHKSNGSSQILMDDILNAYTSNPAYVNKEYLIREATLYWREFTTIINRQAGHKVKYFSDVMPEWVKIWEQEINKVATQKSYTKAYWLSKTQRNELGRVKQYPRGIWQRRRVYGIRGLIKHYAKNKIYDPNSPQMKTIKDLEYVLSTVKAFEKPRLLPKTISPDVFQTLYNNADKRMQIMLCLALQCSFTQVDLFNLKKSEINWDTGELHKQREKENKPRMAYISSFVLQMMKEYMNKHNNKTEYIFVNKGIRVKPLAIGKAFFRLRDKLELDKSIMFKQLRKTALTTAAGMGASDLAVKLLAGHSIGISDAYVSRTIGQVKQACIVIAQEYFSGLEK